VWIRNYVLVILTVSRGYHARHDLLLLIGGEREIMKKYIQVIGFTIVATILFGCASTGDNLQRETARSIGGNVSPEQVTVSDIDRGVSDLKWKAAAPSGNYDCSADDMVRRVLCTKK
jgi:hypothetical protein